MALQIGVCAAQPPTRCPFWVTSRHKDKIGTTFALPRKHRRHCEYAHRLLLAVGLLLTNRYRLCIQTTDYPPLPTVRAMLSMQGALSSVR